MRVRMVVELDTDAGTAEVVDMHHFEVVEPVWAGQDHLVATLTDGQNQLRFYRGSQEGHWFTGLGHFVQGAKPEWGAYEEFDNEGAAVEATTKKFDKCVSYGWRK